jgi:iron complex transport system ATP-binding protein
MGRTAYLGAFAGPARGDYAVAMEALAALGIEDHANRISGGQRQLALIARALAQ